MLESNDQKYIQEILIRIEKGTATPAEHHFIDTYFNYLDEIRKGETPFGSEEERIDLKSSLKASLLQEIREENIQIPVVPIHRRSPVKWIAAAVLVIAAGIAVYFFSTPKRDQAAGFTQTETTAPVSHDRAILKLADGKELLLDSLQGNILQQQDLIVNNKNGTVQYNSKATTPEYHTLYTKNGSQYQLQLPDGTHVWLNAASSITYPTIFTGHNRDVTITGEAYFEVARNKDLPFRVKANDLQIEVTGTHFNVNTYTNEPFLTTTLLQGGVNVTRNSHKVTLLPGQQSISGADGTLSVVSHVNTGEVIAWKYGYFHFESAGLETILRQVSRWYDLDIVYEGDIPKEKFFVIIKRNSSLSAVLKVLEANNVRFTIEGKKLTVKAIQ